MGNALAKVNDKARRYKFWLGQKFFDNYAFIHINKCGGTSIEKHLGIPITHDTAEQRIKRIGRARWNDIFTFAVVRHPYAKVVSHYKYRVKTDQTDLADSSIDLNTWIDLAYAQQNPAYFDKPLMFAPCLDWITVDGEIVVKKVIKLEALNEEWEWVCDAIGLPYTPLSNANKTEGHSLEGARSVLNANSIKILNRHFAKDFKAFDYEQWS